MPRQWLDFRSVKAQVTVRDALARYGMLEKLREKAPGKFVGPCPIHRGGNANSFHLDTTKNAFHCFSRCGGGNVLDLVMKIEGCTTREAAEKLSQTFGLTFDTSSAGAGESASVSQEVQAPNAQRISSPPEGDPINPPLARPLENLRADHDYILGRGITVTTARHFGIGFCSRGMMRGRIAIPIHDDRNNLVAYAGRAVSEELARREGKYRLPRNFRKSHVLYNLCRAKGSETLILVEGFFDSIKLHQAGFANTVSLMGSTMSAEQEKLLVESAARVVLVLDGDEAGRECERQIYRRLRSRLFLKSVHLDTGEQPDSLDEERLQELLRSA